MRPVCEPSRDHFVSPCRHRIRRGNLIGADDAGMVGGRWYECAGASVQVRNGNQCIADRRRVERRNASRGAKHTKWRVALAGVENGPRTDAAVSNHPSTRTAMARRRQDTGGEDQDEEEVGDLLMSSSSGGGSSRRDGGPSSSEQPAKRRRNTDTRTRTRKRQRCDGSEDADTTHKTWPRPVSSEGNEDDGDDGDDISTTHVEDAFALHVERVARRGRWCAAPPSPQRPRLHSRSPSAPWLRSSSSSSSSAASSIDFARHSNEQLVDDDGRGDGDDVSESMLGESTLNALKQTMADRMSTLFSRLYDDHRRNNTTNNNRGSIMGRRDVLRAIACVEEGNHLVLHRVKRRFGEDARNDGSGGVDRLSTVPRRSPLDDELLRS